MKFRNDISLKSMNILLRFKNTIKLEPHTLCLSGVKLRGKDQGQPLQPPGTKM